MTDKAGSSDLTSELQEKWAVAKPTKVDFAAVVTDINATKLVGEASVFERGPHLPITHMAYFKPNMDAFLVELKSKDRRSAKEWEYVNGSGVWVETGLSALSLCKEAAKDMDEMARYLSLAEASLKAALEVLSMRAQYFRDTPTTASKKLGRWPFSWGKDMMLCTPPPIRQPVMNSRESWRPKLPSSLLSYDWKKHPRRKRIKAAHREMPPTVSNDIGDFRLKCFEGIALVA